MMSLEHFALLVAIGAFFAIEVYRNDRLRRHAVAILTRHKAKLYDFLDPVIDDIAEELCKEVSEHDREWITDEVQRQMLEVGVFIFTEMGKQKAKEIVKDIIEDILQP
ncbi:MAG: hypothetical protein HZB92_08345 [Euryarchaeota archaeon]|nr:hypothetical protein [Euryarchaeota archaeon]